jgi:O-antigen ligase
LLLIVSALKGDGIKSFIITKWSGKKVPVIIVITFLLLPTISLLYTINIEFGILKIIHLYISLIPSLFAFLILIKFDRILLRKLTLIILFYALLFSILILILQPFIHATAYSFSFDRWSHVLAGRFLIIALIIGFYFFFTSKEIRKTFFYFALLIIILAALYTTALRASMLSMIVSLPILILLLWKKQQLNFKSLIITTLFVLTLLPFYYLTDENISQKRLQSLYAAVVEGEYRDGAIISRIEAYSVSKEIFKENWLLGIGIGGFNGYNNLHLTKMMKYPHNLLVEIGIELGVIGLTLFIFLLMLTLRNGFYEHPLLFTIIISAFILSLFSKDIASNTMLLTFIPLGWYRNR